MCSPRQPFLSSPEQSPHPSNLRLVASLELVAAQPEAIVGATAMLLTETATGTDEKLAVSSLHFFCARQTTSSPRDHKTISILLTATQLCSPDTAVSGFSRCPRWLPIRLQSSTLLFRERESHRDWVCNHHAATLLRSRDHKRPYSSSELRMASDLYWVVMMNLSGNGDVMLRWWLYERGMLWEWECCDGEGESVNVKMRMKVIQVQREKGRGNEDSVGNESVVVPIVKRKFPYQNDSPLLFLRSVKQSPLTPTAYEISKFGIRLRADVASCSFSHDHVTGHSQYKTMIA
ncbi:hypothetical protein DEO72_LG5g1390 [Vigna unguiculata]|uniref:Uncharacterized protein n=1 Tax=Vigna unguiculata TaxID=3917 RepID=A0A4D6LXA8_VIGUN|nr:hypothetical protein DEO72_LG5g1390 [Vigna unguiculata]